MDGVMAAHHHGSLHQREPGNIPSFMKTTASVSNKIASQRTEDREDVDIAKLVARDSQLPGFSSFSNKSAKQVPRQAPNSSPQTTHTSNSHTTAPQGWASKQPSEPLADSWGM